jgi:hypothetical protein
VQINAVARWVRYKAVSKNKATHSDTDKFIPIPMYTWHTGSRWYTADLHVVTTDIHAFFTLWHQSLYPDIEEIGVKCLQPRGDSLLHVGTWCKSLDRHALLKQPNEMETTGCEIKTVGRVVYNLRGNQSQARLAVGDWRYRANGDILAQQTSLLHEWVPVTSQVHHSNTQE